jgi:hypothetical protein
MYMNMEEILLPLNISQTPALDRKPYGQELDPEGIRC